MMINSPTFSSKIKLLLPLTVLGTVWGIIVTILFLTQIGERSSINEHGEAVSVDAILIPAQCPSNIPITQGSTWRNITIGVSSAASVSELYGIQFSFQRPPTWSEEGFGDTYDILLTREHAEELALPMSVKFCTVDNKIMALTMDLPKDGSYPLGDVIEWINKYGLPKIVTWKEGVSDWCNRVVVWPEYGISVEFVVGSNGSVTQMTSANVITLLPYGVSEDYVSQWPYSDFLNNPKPTTDNLEGCPSEENPLNSAGIGTTQTPDLY